MWEFMVVSSYFFDFQARNCQNRKAENYKKTLVIRESSM